MNKSTKICYEAFGDAGNPALILIMGLGAQLINWPQLFIDGLVDQGFYVIVFDNRDVGLSQSYADMETLSFAEAMQKRSRAKISLIHIL